MPTLTPAPIEDAPMLCSEDLVCSDLLEVSDADGFSAATADTGTLVPA